MTNDDFLFWERAFLAAMQGLMTRLTNYESFDSFVDDGNRTADAALAVWREKRASVDREHVEKVVTNG